MEALLAPLLTCWVMLAPPGIPAPLHASASTTTSVSQPGMFAAAIQRDVPRMSAAALRRAKQADPAPRDSGSWIARHPAIFGALVGAGAGAAYAGVADNELLCSGSDEDCLFYNGSKYAVGAGIGAAIGAFVGLLVGMAR